MGIAGAFAGLAGSGETLGHYYQLQENTLSGVLVNLGFTGIAVALLGRNTPIGIILAALLFSGLDSGARQLSGEIPAELARRARDDHPGRRDPVRRRRGDPALAVPPRPKQERSLHTGPTAPRGADARGAAVNGPSGAVTAPTRRPHVRAQAARPGGHGLGGLVGRCWSCRRS